ncbi:hypothetical protein Q7P37_003714 [Cladosporium fusiforme]
MDPTQTLTLNRLLQRLDHTLLSQEGVDPKLRYSQYERNRVGANIEHARTLLLTLEKQSSTTRAQIAQKQNIQADLQRKRELVKKLNARLQELNELDEGDSESDDEEDEDIPRPSYAPARPDADAGLDTGNEPPAQNEKSQFTEPQQQQEMRSRKPLSAEDNRSATSTTARENLFAGRKQEHQNLETTEALMSHNRSEQDALTNGLLGLARALKESTVNFGSSLEQEKDIMKRAEGSLEKSSLGMEAAGKRMGTLRRMSEGQGWWGRVKLYACIFALWVFLFLIVFLGPKLRF